VTSCYYDKAGNEISAEEFAALWQQWDCRCVAEHRIYDRCVIASWLGTTMPYDPPRDGGALFQTTVFRPSDDAEGVRFGSDETLWVDDGEWQQRCYSTELAARTGHAEVVSDVVNARRQ